MVKMKASRITIRDQQLSDLNCYHQWRSDPEIMRYSVLERSTSKEESRRWLQNDMEHQKTDNRTASFFSIIHNQSGDYIGVCGFHIIKTGGESGIAEIGYFILKEFWGQGYAAEAASLLVTYLFDNYPIHKIIANCDARNTGSERVMQKIGMTKEAVLKLDRFNDNRWNDEVRYCIFNEES